MRPRSLTTVLWDNASPPGTFQTLTINVLEALEGESRNDLFVQLTDYLRSVLGSGDIAVKKKCKSMFLRSLTASGRHRQ